MTHRSLPCLVIATTLLLTQTPVVLQPLLAAPYQQGATPGKQNAAEQDRLLSGPPFSLAQILGLLDVHPDRLSKAITNRGLTFEATPENLEALKKAGASEKLLDLIRRRAPVISPPPPPPAPSGNIAVKCSPAECNISLDGKSNGQTKGGIMEIKGLPVKDILVDFERDGYIGQQKSIAILDGKDVSAEAELEPSEATKEQFGADLWSMTLQALGGDAGLTDVASITASGAVALWNKDGQRSDWTLSTLLKLPSMVLFDLEGSSTNFWISLIGDKYKSGGDRKGFSALFGGGAASDKNRILLEGDFDSDLRVFRDFQVSTFVGRIKSGGFRLSAASHDGDDNGEFHLRAAGNAEAYDITLSNEKLPVRMKYESALGLGSGMEVVYSDYKAAGRGEYPMTMLIKLSDAPHHGMEVKFEGATVTPDLREKDFNARPKPRK